MQWVTDTILNWYSFWAWNRAQKYIETNTESVAFARQQLDKQLKHLEIAKDDSDVGFMFPTEIGDFAQRVKASEQKFQIAEAKLKMYEAQRDYHKLIINRQ